MIRAVIIDDEPNNVEALQKLLEDYCPSISVTGTAGDLQTARVLITRENPELVFLDIEMPYGNAFELLNQLMPVYFEIIFVTAFDSYALKAIKYSALDYLLKPVNIKELQNAVFKATERIHTKNIHKRIDTLIYNMKTPGNSSRRLALPTIDGFEFIDSEQIVRLEANNNYTNICLENKTKVLIAKPLKEFEDLLDEMQFSRIHHSHIINHSFVKKYHRGRGGYIEMKDGTRIEVSTRRKDGFLGKFN